MGIMEVESVDIVMDWWTVSMTIETSYGFDRHGCSTSDFMKSQWT